MRSFLRAFAVIFALASLARAAAPKNSCIACHRAATAVPSLEHTFDEWAESPHAKAGVNCEICHGGDPSRPGQAEAHAGILSSTDPKSKVYYTAIPGTCGACHAAELAAFKASVHYSVLMKTGRGPDCLSCHGAMADTVIEPRYMEMTCTLCHRTPTQAYSARMAVEDARAALRGYESAAATAEDAGAARRQELALRGRLKALLVEWHGFDAAKVRAGAIELARDAAAARGALKPKTLTPE